MVIDGKAVVGSVEPDSPAAKSGVTPGWEIDRVDGKPLAPGLRKIDRNFRHSGLLVGHRGIVSIHLRAFHRADFGPDHGDDHPDGAAGAPDMADVQYRQRHDARF